MLTRPLRSLRALALLVPALLAPAAPTPGPIVDADYEADVEFALDALEEHCGHFFEVKDVDWKKVRKQFAKGGEEGRRRPGAPRPAGAAPRPPRGRARPSAAAAGR